MELKNVISMEISREDRAYRFEMPYGAPLGEAYDVAFQMLQGVVEMSRQAAEKAAPVSPPSDQSAS